MALIEDAATRLARTFTETAAERNARLQAQFEAARTTTTTTTPSYPATSYMAPVVKPTSSFVRRPVEPVVQAPEQQFVSAGYDPHEAFRLAAIDAGRAVTAPISVPSVPPTSLNLARRTQPETQQVTSVAPTSINVAALMGETPREQVVISRQPSQFTGPEYYRGGSEQAYLEPVAQAEAFFLGTQGERWQLGASYRGVTPEDRNPPAFLSMSTVRILTQGVEEQFRVDPELIGRLYEFDPVTNMWVLKQGVARPPLTGGYGFAGGEGYGGGRGGGFGGLPFYGGGRAAMGLVNWRIGF